MTVRKAYAERSRDHGALLALRADPVNPVADLVSVIRRLVRAEVQAVKA